VALLGECTGSLCIAYMPGLSQVSMVSQQGYITHQQLSQVQLSKSLHYTLFLI